MADLVSLAEAKAYLRVVHGIEDDLIVLLISAASEAVQDVTTAWDGQGDAPDRIKLAVLARVQLAFYDRGTVGSSKGELPMLNPLRTLEL